MPPNKADDDRVYIIQGHGSEQLYVFDKRPKVPKGCTLVTFTQCAVPLIAERGAQIVDFLRNPRNRKRLVKADPVALQKHLPTLRVYREGDVMPSLRTTLSLDFEDDKASTKKYTKAGVYKVSDFPTVDRKRFPLPIMDYKTLPYHFHPQPGEKDDESKVTKVRHAYKYTVAVTPQSEPISDDIYNEIYRGSIYYPSRASLQRHATVGMHELMKRLGSGVYYFMGCRSTTEFPDVVYSTAKDWIRKTEGARADRRYKKQMDEWLVHMGRIPKPANSVSASPTSTSGSELSISPRTQATLNRVLPYQNWKKMENTNNLQYARDYAYLIEKNLRSRKLSPQTRELGEKLKATLSRVAPEIYDTFQKSDEQQKKNRGGPRSNPASA